MPQPTRAPNPRRFHAPRGTADILPPEQPYWRHIQETAVRLCRLYGYQRLDTPVFEDTRLFVRGVGEATDIVEKEMYSFQDRGGDSLTLRPEGTAPVCRAYLEQGMQVLPQPVKLYYLAPIFRYDRPQAGRYRQHHQFGYEALGSADPALDAEVIQLAHHFYGELGLAGLTLNLNSIGCPRCRPGYLEALRAHYQPLAQRLCRDCQARLQRNPLRLLDCKEAGCQPFAQAAPRSTEHLCQDCALHFSRLRRYLDLLGIPYTLEHRLVRGLDYYTNTVFEFQPQEEGAQSTVGGGGRYDGLIEELGGKPTPGVGFATGIERIILNLKRQGLDPPGEETPEYFIAYLGEEAKAEALRLVARLRAAGHSALLSCDDRSLKAQLRQASARGAPYAIILGEAEMQQGTAVLRNMASGEQRMVNRKDFARGQKAAEAPAQGPSPPKKQLHPVLDLWGISRDTVEWNGILEEIYADRARASRPDTPW